MARSSYSVACVSGLGASIGALVSEELASRVGFAEYTAGSLGMLIGAVVGYIAVDFRGICVGIKNAWQNTANWRPYKPYWKALFSSGLVFIVFSIEVAFLFNLRFLDSGTQHSQVSTFCWTFLPMTAIAAGMYRRSSFETSEDYLERLQAAQKENLAAAWLITPIGIVIKVTKLIMYILVGLIVGLICTIPLLIPFVRDVLFALGRFIKYAFIEIHSDRRIVCFTNAGLGTGVGFFCFHHALAGLCAGALLGFINYEVVSVRCLKVKAS